MGREEGVVESIFEFFTELWTHFASWFCLCTVLEHHIIIPSEWEGRRREEREGE